MRVSLGLIIRFTVGFAIPFFPICKPLSFKRGRQVFINKMISVSSFFFLLVVVGSAVGIECPSHTPFLCADRSCVASKEDCQGFEGCTNPKLPHFCSDGTCAASYRKCLLKFYPCPKLTDKKCSDGVCRSNCADFHSSACSFFKPIRCSDGSCASSLVECSSHLCPADAPFRCKDNSCVQVLDACAYPLNTYVAKTHSVDAADSDFALTLRSQGGVELATVNVPRGANIKIKGVATSQIKNTQFLKDYKHEGLYEAFFGQGSDNLQPFQFIRSAVLNITSHVPVDPEKPEQHLRLRVRIRLDLLKPLQNFEKISFGQSYCLAHLVSGSTWRCLSGNEARASRKRGDFLIQLPGVYAVIFFPDTTDPTLPPGSYCGYLCQSKRYFLAFWFLIFPVILLALFIFLNLYRLQTQVANATTENYFLQNKMDELENVQVDFTGQTVLEKLDEGVQYFSNPLRNEEQESIEEFKVLNKKLQTVKDESRRVNYTRNKLINANKAKLEEIKALRQKLGEYA